MSKIRDERFVLILHSFWINIQSNIIHDQIVLFFLYTSQSNHSNDWKKKRSKKDYSSLVCKKKLCTLEIYTHYICYYPRHIASSSRNMLICKNIKIKKKNYWFYIIILLGCKTKIKTHIEQELVHILWMKGWLYNLSSLHSYIMY